MISSLSEESKEILRQMLESEAWRLYESEQQEQINNLRVLAKNADTPELQLKFYTLAQGREDSILEFKQDL